jgi:DNA-binding NtrC family response regulator
MLTSMGEATVVATTRVEIQGGTIAIAGEAAKRVEIGPGDVCIVGRQESCNLVLDDDEVSAVHLELASTERGLRARDLGSRNGTFLGETRIGEVYVTRPTTFGVGRSFVEYTPTRPTSASKRGEHGPLVGSAPQMRMIYDFIERAAPTDLSVLILGETGTGKEVVATMLHQRSRRSSKPFVVIDCSTIPPSLAESALFGHEKGAFTGAATTHVSPFVEASGGTVFLDEFGDLPPDVQPKLLRALADRRIKSVGSNKYKPIDIRLIAATQRDIVRDVNTNAFRGDLYFRVADTRVELPPLRERLDDIPALVERFAGVAFPRITGRSIEQCMKHSWPGNVRELQKVVEVAVALTEQGPIDLDVFIRPIKQARAVLADVPDGKFKETKQGIVTRFEREYFTELYARCKGNISEMSRRAGLDRAAVRKYLREYELKDVETGSEGDA